MSKSPTKQISADVSTKVSAEVSAAIWLADSRRVDDDALARHAAWLNPAEASRYRRFLRPQRQRQFLIGRILLRQALGQLLGIAANAISLTERPGQAPRLNWSGPAPGFSLSHSGPWVACAVSAHTALGLDIEMMDPTRDLAALSAHSFDADDLRWWNAQPENKRLAAFYSRWSSKEARYKLASSTGSEAEASCIALTHPAISMVLCSALPLTATSPAVEHFSLLAESPAI